MIQHPVSLRGIQKQVRGIEGRKLVHKDTAFSSWQAFEEEIEFVWRNAREFNEDGSEIVVLAAVLEVNPEPWNNVCEPAYISCNRIISDVG